MYSIEELKKKYDEETYKIIGAAMEVHRHLGCGFLEAVYGDALAIEFTNRNIPFEREKLINIKYKDTTLEHYYVADFVCYDSIIVELKAVTELNKTFEAQVLNYLNATGYFFEVHPTPDQGLSDAANMLELDKLQSLVSKLIED